MLQFLGEPRFQNTALALEQVTYLVALLVCRQTWVLRNELVLLLWGDVSEEIGRKRLRQLLYRAKTFEFTTGLITDPQRVRFEGQTDVLAFRVAIQENRFDDAVKMYQGEFLLGINLLDLPELEEIFTLEREDLARLYHQAVLQAVTKLEKPAAAVLLERALTLNPLSEELLGACWQVCDLIGQKRVFSVHHKAMKAFDLEPSTEWLARREVLESRVLEVTRVTLRVPPPSVTLIGRQSELNLIEQRMNTSDCRLMTLIGVGGAGKTRLAITVANRFEHQFKAGACFVALAGVNSTSLVPEAILEALGLDTAGHTDSQLLEFLNKNQLLLVLDNLEHLPGVNDLVAKLLEKSPNLKILTTSREALGLSYEHLIDIEGLPAPDTLFPLDTQDAALVFLQAARKVQFNFDLENDVISFTRIYRSVSGIPLGLELAASWVRILTLEEIAIELERSLDLLVVESRDIPERHRSFAATFRSSWILLSQPERAALARLSVMRGSFSREWALKVSGASLGVLLKLINKSMVSKRDARFYLHELIRQYALRELNLEAQTLAMTALSELCLALSDLWYPERNSVRHVEMSRKVEAEMDNLRPTLEWCLTHNPRFGSQMLGLLEHFFNTRGYHREGLAWGLRFKACAETQPQDMDRAHLLWMIASMSKELSQYLITRAAILEYLAIARVLNHPQLQASSEKFLGLIERDLGNLTEAEFHFKTAIDLHEQNQNINQIAMCNTDLGLTLLYQDKLKAAQVCFERALALKRSLNDPLGAAYALGHLSTVIGLLGDTDREASMLEDSIRAKRDANDLQGIAIDLQAFGNLARRTGQEGLARDYLSQALQTFVRLGQRWYSAQAFMDFAQLEYQVGKRKRALSLYLASQSLLQNIGCKSSYRATINAAHIEFEHGLSVLETEQLKLEMASWDIEQTLLFALGFENAAESVAAFSI